MIVYGDPSYEATLAGLLTGLQSRLRALTGASSTDCPALDDLRTLLIQAGQLEQAAEDGLSTHLPPRRRAEATVGSNAYSSRREPTSRLVSREFIRQAGPDDWLDRLRAATDHAAAAFCLGWLASTRGAPAVPPEIGAPLEQMQQALAGLDVPPAARLTIKIPEGFAFYALYPEQYCVSAQRWMAGHARGCPPGAGVPGVVVGIRSIGTTLSAVVAALLAIEGWTVHRMTVRPTGPPYSRQVELRAATVKERWAWALIVDEGPGQSGSSMAATAEALAHAGVDASSISFLPSHAGGPGWAAAEPVRAWWSTTPCYATLLAELRWQGRSLPETLAARSAALFDTREPFEAEDVGGGMWRRAVYPDGRHWPAVCAPFERTKYRCTARASTLPVGASVLWKFAGLAGVDGSGESAAERSFAQLSERAEAGWTPAPLGLALGFVAMPWIEGAPLTRADADSAVLAHIGRYLAEVAGPPLTGAEQEAALGRLCEMLYWNTWEVLGEETALRTRPWGDIAADLSSSLSAPAYGDGHLAPHEWRRTPSGQLLKMDSTGHASDHTIIGRQPLIWDIAGALVEWELEPPAAAPLLGALRETVGLAFPPSLLVFYRMAYAAFRMGLCSMCAGMSAHDPEEQARLRHESARCGDELVRLLATEAVSGRGDAAVIRGTARPCR